MMSMRDANTAAGKRTKFGLALEQSAKEILAHLKDEMKLPTRVVVVPDQVDVKRLRTKELLLVSFPFEAQIVVPRRSQARLDGASLCRSTQSRASFRSD
jgi:hypothetical protein